MFEVVGEESIPMSWTLCGLPNCRIRTHRDYYAACTNAVGEWTQEMRQAGMVSRLVLDTYHPEIGRYGHGQAMDAAEDVFVADSRLAASALRDLPATTVHPTALAVANMVGIVHGFFGDLAETMVWLAARPVPSTPATDRAPSDDWPGGHINLDLSHGICGPLTLLATAMRRGVAVAGQAETIERIHAFLDEWRCGTDGRSWWPGMISPAEWKAHAVHQPGPQRPSWRYGTPGLARAQLLAALALGDQQRQRRAEDALAGCVADEDQLSQLGDDSLCHGWAGLLQTTRRAAADAGPNSELAGLLPHLQTRFGQHCPRLSDQDGPRR